MWPQKWGRFLLARISEHVAAGTGARPGKGEAGRNAAGLNDPPDKVGEKPKEQQHKYPTHPDQEVPSHLRRVNLFFVHAPRYQISQPLRT